MQTHNIYASNLNHASVNTNMPKARINDFDATSILPDLYGVLYCYFSWTLITISNFKVTPISLFKQVKFNFVCICFKFHTTTSFARAKHVQENWY